MVLTTAPKPVKVSAPFVAGVAIATTVGVLVGVLVADAIRIEQGPKEDEDS